MTRPTRLSDAEISAGLTTLPEWVHQGDTLQRTFTFKDFPAAVAFVNRVVAPAEAMDHHPDIDIRYNRVVVTLSTHSAGGLTRADLALAAAINGLADA